MPSTVVISLAERPAAELRTMLSTLDADRARVEAERVRVEVEFEQVAEALSLKSGQAGTQPGRRHRPARPGATQKRILDAVAASDGPVSPAQVMAAMEADGRPTPSRGSIHNTIGRLVRNGLLTKPGGGQYELASQDGSESEPSMEPSRNGEGRPLSLADPNHSRA